MNIHMVFLVTFYAERSYVACHIILFLAGTLGSAKINLQIQCSMYLLFYETIETVHNQQPTHASGL